MTFVQKIDYHGEGYKVLQGLPIFFVFLRSVSNIARAAVVLISREIIFLTFPSLIKS